MRIRLRAAVLPALAGLAAAAPAAGAADVSSVPQMGQSLSQVVALTSATADPDVVTAGSGPAAGIRFTDTIGLTPGVGCRRSDPADVTTADCLGNPPGAALDVEVEPGPGDDQVTLLDGISAFVDGGPGNDLVDVGTSLTTARGGPGADRMVGGATENGLQGGDGDDRIDGGGGPDDLEGDAGDDVVHGGDGNDLIDGIHVGDQRLHDPGSRDRLLGDAGYDDIIGTQDDALVSRDHPAAPDKVDCVRGGVAHVDVADLVLGHCHAVRRSGTARAVPVGDARFLSDLPTYVVFDGPSHPAVPHGDVATGVGCPVDRRRACRGVLTIVDGGQVLGHKAFGAIAPGRGRQLNVHVGRAAARRARQGDRRVTLRVTTRRRGPDLRVRATAPVR